MLVWAAICGWLKPGSPMNDEWRLSEGCDMGELGSIIGGVRGSTDRPPIHPSTHTVASGQGCWPLALGAAAVFHFLPM